jgi:hypothetical protein
MGEIVNLRRARKRQMAERAQVEAAANRVAFGVSKEMRTRAQAERVLAQERLVAHRRPERGEAD